MQLASVSKLLTRTAGGFWRRWCFATSSFVKGSRKNLGREHRLCKIPGNQLS